MEVYENRCNVLDHEHCVWTWTCLKKIKMWSLIQYLFLCRTLTLMGSWLNGWRIYSNLLCWGAWRLKLPANWRQSNISCSSWAWRLSKLKPTHVLLTNSKRMLGQPKLQVLNSYLKIGCKCQACHLYLLCQLGLVPWKCPPYHQSLPKVKRVLHATCPLLIGHGFLPYIVSNAAKHTCFAKGWVSPPLSLPDLCWDSLQQDFVLKNAGSESKSTKQQADTVVKKLGQRKLGNAFVALRKIALHPLLSRQIVTDDRLSTLSRLVHQR